ncbi:hypothetical protein AVEN_99370-1 [Araneus ventricosus]|uniref:Pre-C2HC domain-containing protein n=1 Tax=Araneus ventricosus TaxID=182803 RepID=A0A4Y2MZ55_ARAVE|nr:hypothetical protein AVEN_99370-1 [Araneus ventricosus]
MDSSQSESGTQPSLTAFRTRMRFCHVPPSSNISEIRTLHHWPTPPSTTNYIRRPRLSHTTSSPVINEITASSLASEGEFLRCEQTPVQRTSRSGHKFSAQKGESRGCAARIAPHHLVLSCESASSYLTLSQGVYCTKGDQPSRECPSKGKPDAPIKCTNCNGPHTANYRGCPRYPKNIQRSKLQTGKSFAEAARTNTQNVNKPAAPNAHTPTLMPGQNVNKQSPQNRLEQTGSRTHPTVNNGSLPTGEGLNEVMALVAEVHKIFQGITNISETLRNIQATDNAWEKFMILTEAFRPNCVTP